MLTVLVLDWDFLLATELLPQYMEWLDLHLQEKYHDEAWMKQFEQLAPVQAREETREATPEPRQVAVSGDGRIVLTTYSPATPVRTSSRKGK